MKQIIKRGIVFLLAVVMMICQSSLFQVWRKKKGKLQKIQIMKKKSRRRRRDTKEMVSAPSATFNGSIDWESFV